MLLAHAQDLDDVVSKRDREAIAEAMVPNARNAIVALRKAVKAAAADGSDSVDVSGIERAIPDARSYIRQKQYDQLRSNQQELADILDEANGWVDCMDLKQRYHDHVDEPGGEKQRRRNLDKLENYGFIESRGATKDAGYRYINLE